MNGAGDRLSPLALARAAWLDLARDFALFARLAAPPFAWAVAIAIALPEFARAAPYSWLLLLWPMLAGVTLVLLMPTATAWHRLVLLGRDDPHARLRYAFGREEWLYFRQTAGLLALMLLIGGACGVLLAFGAFLTGNLETISDPEISRGVIQPAVVLIALALVAPRFLGLPAAAAGRPIAREALRAAARHAHLPIVLALLIAYVPYAVAERIANAALQAFPRAASLVVEALKMLAIGASLGVLSHAHLRLFGADGAGRPGEPR